MNTKNPCGLRPQGSFHARTSSTTVSPSCSSSASRNSLCRFGCADCFRGRWWESAFDTITDGENGQPQKDGFGQPRGRLDIRADGGQVLVGGLETHRVERDVQGLLEALHPRLGGVRIGLLMGFGLPGDDRADLQLVRRARAWFAVLRELGADDPEQPTFRALTVKGSLWSYSVNRKRGTRMRPGSLIERANTDMVERGVPVSERNKAGR